MHTVYSKNHWRIGTQNIIYLVEQIGSYAEGELAKRLVDRTLAK